MKDIGIAFSKEELEKKGITVCEVKEDMQMIFPGVTLYRNFERIVEYEQLNPRFFVKKRRQGNCCWLLCRKLFSNTLWNRGRNDCVQYRLFF
ncbi:hypothetical protein NIA73_04275 [Anaerobutyricum hallii]|nr:hypothetical protein [Anaerobutyricum hallii]